MRDRLHYAYEMIRELRCGGFPMVNERSVYPVLGRLVEDGLAWFGDHVASTERLARRYYRLTPEGKAKLEELTRAFFGHAAVVEEIEGRDRGSIACR